MWNDNTLWETACFSWGKTMSVFLEFRNTLDHTLDQPSIWNFADWSKNLLKVKRHHQSGVGPTRCCISRHNDLRLFRLLRQVSVPKFLWVDLFWFLRNEFFVECSHKIQAQRLIPRPHFQRFGSPRSFRFFLSSVDPQSQEFWPIENSCFENVRCHVDRV